MKARGIEFRVGLFTLAGLGATLFAIFVLSPDMFKSRASTPYYTELKDASGILPKTQVKTNGVTIGKVTSVELTLDATRVSFDVRTDVQVPIGSTLEVRTVGFLGDKFLEIHRVENTQGLIAPSGLIPRNMQNVDLNEVISLVGEISKDVKKVTTTLRNVLGSDQGEKSIATIIGNVEATTEHAKLLLAENRQDIRTTIANIEKVSATLRASVGDRERDMQSIVTNIRTFTQSLNEVLNEENKEKMASILASFDQSMVEVQGATKNIKLISERVEKGEGTLGRLVNDDKVLEELEGAVKDIRDVIAPANKLQIGVDYHGEFRRDESAQNYVNLIFRTRPESYYLVGFTDQQAETVDRTTETIDGDASDSTTRVKETIKRQSQLAINLQIAKRWYNAAFRFGLFESSGGMAADYYLFGDRFRFSAEAFQWKGKGNDTRRVAHLKAYASVLFFNHVYAMVGIDDPTRLDTATGKVDPDKNYFIGAGVSFNDQDLKALFGAAALSR